MCTTINTIYLFLVSIPFDVGKKTFSSDGRFYQILDTVASNSAEGDLLCREALTDGGIAHIGSSTEQQTIEVGIVRILWNFDMRVAGSTNMTVGCYLDVTQYNIDDSGMYSFRFKIK